jgi:DNA-binding transcriptional LysR family regulator
MDRLTQIEAFVEAVEQGSLAGAARRAKVTPVMIGRRIDALERRLGVKLLHRSTRHLSLSEDGQLFLDPARRLLGDLARAEAAMGEGRHRATGHLLVAAPGGFGRRHVAPHAPAFLARNEGVRVSFDLSDEVVDLARGHFDVAIRIGGVLDPQYVAVKLAPNRRVVCATPAYLARHGRPRVPEDLRAHNCFAFNVHGGQPRGWYFRRAGKKITVRVSGNLECNDGELLARWTAEGLGLGWRSTWEIQPQLSRGELVTVLDDYALPSYDIVAMYLPQRHVPAKVRLFVAHLKAIYAAPDSWLRAD